jgi:hypothetical protein
MKKITSLIFFLVAPTLMAEVRDSTGVLEQTDKMFSGRELSETYAEGTWVKAIVTRCTTETDCETFDRKAWVTLSTPERVEIQIETKMPDGPLKQTQVIEKAVYDSLKSNPLRRVIRDTLGETPQGRIIELTSTRPDPQGTRIDYRLLLKSVELRLFIVLNTEVLGIAQIMAAGIQDSPNGVRVISYGQSR